MFFVPCSIGRQRNPLALAAKKGIALQSGRWPSAGVAPVSSGSGASVTTSPAGQAPPMVVPVPFEGQAYVGAQGAPSEVMEVAVAVTDGS